VLVASQFAGDNSELALIQHINAVKRAMGAGRVVVLVNHDRIYESLYDVLNQRYVTRRDAHGRVTRLLRLAVGAHSQLVPVDTSGFKVIVVAEEEDAYERLDLPLLNRFEKQTLNAADVLGARQSAAVRDLRAWVGAVAAEVADERAGAAAVVECFSGLGGGGGGRLQPSAAAAAAAAASADRVASGGTDGALASLVLASSHFDDGAVPPLASLRAEVGLCISCERCRCGSYTRSVGFVGFSVIPERTTTTVEQRVAPRRARRARDAARRAPIGACARARAALLRATRVARVGAARPAARAATRREQLRERARRRHGRAGGRPAADGAARARHYAHGRADVLADVARLRGARAARCSQEMAVWRVRIWRLAHRKATVKALYGTVWNGM